ncbi:MAG: hypothetical protein ACRD28_11340, partial [Acidobacteriaceae bacterium]
MVPFSMACLALLAVPVAARAGAMKPLTGMTSFHRHDGYLGVDFENLTRQQREKLNLPPSVGVEIAAVDHDA